MNLRAFIVSVIAGIAGIFLPSRTRGSAIRAIKTPPRPRERFSVRVTTLSPEAVAASMYILDRNGEPVYYDPEVDIILHRRIKKHRAVIMDQWSNPAMHIVIESPLFEPHGEAEARKILDECCEYAMRVRAGKIPSSDRPSETHVNRGTVVAPVIYTRI